MIDSRVDLLRQENALVGCSDVYSEQRVCGAIVGLQQHHQGESYFEQHEKSAPPALTQAPQQHVEEHQELDTVNSEQHQQRYIEMSALEQQRQHYYSAEAIQRQRLLDVEVNRSRLLERLQLARILRSKEAAAKVEVLNRRMQQHEAEAAWRSQRNSYMREQAFQALHWKLTQKDLSDAVKRLLTQQNKFEKEVMRFLRADTRAAAYQEPPTYAATGCAGAIRGTATEESSVTVKLESECCTRGIAKKRAASNGRSCTTGSGSGMGFGGQREDLTADALSRATATASAAQDVTQYSHPFASVSASADSRGNSVVSRDCHSEASVQRCTTYKSVCVAEPTTSSLSPRTFSCGRSSMLKHSNCPRGAAVPSSKASEYSFDSTEPFHLQLLALRYKQEMAALELQQVAHRRVAPPSTRHDKCGTSSQRVKPDCVTVSSSTATARVSSSSTANPHFDNGGNEPADQFPLTEGPVRAEAHLPRTTQQPPELRPAAESRLVTNAGARTTSAGAVFPPRTSRCFSPQTSVQSVHLSPTLPEAETVARTEFSPSRPGDVCSAPIIFPVESFATPCPPAQPTSSARNSPPYRTSLHHSSEGRVAGKKARAPLMESPAGKDENVTANEAIEDGALEGEKKAGGKASAASCLLKGGFDPNAATREVAVRPPCTVAESRESAHSHQLSHVSQSTRRILEWQSSVGDEACCFEWMSPDIPTEKPLPELHRRKVL